MPIAALPVRLALAAAVAIASTASFALTADPTGDWSGTVKCTGPSTDAPKGSTSTASARVTIVGERMVAYALAAPYLMFTASYIPDAASPASKGTLGYFSTEDNIAWHETGQAKIERGKDGKVTLDGKSYVLLLFPDVYAASGLCEWKLAKTSDAPSPLPADLPV
jgi:hypothetical protein